MLFNLWKLRYDGACAYLVEQLPDTTSMTAGSRIENNISHLFMGEKPALQEH